MIFVDQIVLLGPKNEAHGQYEFIVLSNWAKYPLIAMARNVQDFNAKYRAEFVHWFHRKGYINEFSELVNFDTFIRFDFYDYSKCLKEKKKNENKKEDYITCCLG